MTMGRMLWCEGEAAVFPDLEFWEDVHYAKSGDIHNKITGLPPAAAEWPPARDVGGRAAGASEGRWPEIPKVARKSSKRQAEFEKAKYQATLDLALHERKARFDKELSESLSTAQGESRRSAAMGNHYTQQQEILKAFLEVGKGQLDRSLKRAELVQTTAAAMGTIYLGILGLTFAAADETPLPLAAVIPAVFLGTSFFGVAMFVGFLRDEDMNVPPSEPTLSADVASMRDFFVDWAQRLPMLQAKWLRVGIASLGAGAATMPLPFTALPDWFVWLSAGLGAIAVGIAGVAERRTRKSDAGPGVGREQDGPGNKQGGLARSEEAGRRGGRGTLPRIIPTPIRFPGG